MLSALGENVQSKGAVLFNKEFSVSIKKGCDAVLPILLYVSAILAFPVTWKAKTSGILVGISLLLFINLIRIISLFWIGKYHPDYFNFFHLDVWQVVFIFLGILFWWVWIKKVAIR